MVSQAAYLDLMGVTRWRERGKPQALGVFLGLSANGRFGLLGQRSTNDTENEAGLSALAHALAIPTLETLNEEAALTRLTGVEKVILLGAAPAGLAKAGLSCTQLTHPALSELMQDPTAKAALWQDVWSHR